MANADLPLFFLHIPKTGGTSLIEALKPYYQPEALITENGNLSVEFLCAQESRLTDPVFIYGHPGHETMTFLEGRVRAMTLVRRPRDHAVSNYLHILRDETNPFHSAARNLGFSEFLAIYYYFAIFQTGSLDVSLSPAPIRRFQSDLDAAASRAFDFLSRMFFVGCLEHVANDTFLLSSRLRLPSIIAFGHHNEAPSPPDQELDRLHAEYEELRREPRIAHFIAIEEALYCKALSLKPVFQRKAMEEALLETAAALDPRSSYLAFSGEGGSVFLIRNWAARMQADAGTHWWTSNAEESVILVDRTSPDVASLEIEIFVTHFSADYIFEAEGETLNHRIVGGAGARPVIAIDLSALPSGPRALITLRQQRMIAPTLAPYYPALALGNFRLL